MNTNQIKISFSPSDPIAHGCSRCRGTIHSSTGISRDSLLPHKSPHGTGLDFLFILINLIEIYFIPIVSNSFHLDPNGYLMSKLKDLKSIEKLYKAYPGNMGSHGLFSSKRIQHTSTNSWWLTYPSLKSDHHMCELLEPTESHVPGYQIISNNCECEYM